MDSEDLHILRLEIQSAREHNDWKYVGSVIRKLLVNHIQKWLDVRTIYGRIVLHSISLHTLVSKYNYTNRRLEYVASVHNSYLALKKTNWENKITVSRERIVSHVARTDPKYLGDTAKELDAHVRALAVEIEREIRNGQ